MKIQKKQGDGVGNLINDMYMCNYPCHIDQIKYLVEVSDQNSNHSKKKANSYSVEINFVLCFFIKKNGRQNVSVCIIRIGRNKKSVTYTCTVSHYTLYPFQQK